MCRLYGKFASYLRRVLCKTRLIFSRMNGPIVFSLCGDHLFLLMLPFGPFNSWIKYILSFFLWASLLKSRLNVRGCAEMLPNNSWLIVDNFW